MKLTELAKIALQNMQHHGTTSSLGGLAIGASMTAFERGDTVTGIACLIAGILLVFAQKDAQ